MKCTVIIDPTREEEVVIYAREESALTKSIADLVQDHGTRLIGYREDCATELRPAELDCLTIEQGKVVAITHNGKWRLRRRLYELEQILSTDFIKINQSCIINKKQIARFEATIGGALRIVLKNGYTDSVARRQLKTVKERLGL